MVLLPLVLAGAVLALTPPPSTVVALWVTGPSTHGEIPAAMPPRFVLLQDGQVYVGGTSTIASARLARGDARDVERQVGRVRKLRGLNSTVTMGPGEVQFRLFLRKGPEVLAKGDPEGAPAALRPLAQLIESLRDFTYPGLKAFAPASFLLSLEDVTLVGGCRDWQLPVAPEQLRRGPVVIAAALASTWPTGGYPAAACYGDDRYTVTLRPLLPGEGE